MSRTTMKAIVSMGAALLLLLTSCGESDSDNKRSAELVSELPAEIQSLFDGFTDPVHPSAYDKLKKIAGPWKVCMAYQAANPWMGEVKNEIARVVDEFRRAGKASGSLELAETNGEVALENRQVRALADKGCSVILLAPASPSGSNAAIKSAYEKGIPVISFGGAVTSKYAINVVPNGTLYGRQQAEEITRKIGNKGNVMMIGGIEGLPASIAQGNGAEEVWKKSPDIKVVARLFGKYDVATTKSVVLQALTATTDQVHAVWTAGSEIAAVISAFQQAGRPIPIISGTPSADSLAMMKQNGALDLFGRASVPVAVAHTTVDVTFRVLDGQRPKIGTITYTYPAWGRENLDQWFGPCMKTSAQLPFPVPPAAPLSTEQMNQYFHDGKVVAPYAYNPPPACS